MVSTNVDPAISPTFSMFNRREPRSAMRQCGWSRRPASRGRRSRSDQCNQRPRHTP